MGAPDPRLAGTNAPSQYGVDIAKGRKFWSYQPIKDPPVPAVHNRSWPKNPIDNFILAKLEEKGMTFAPPTDKRTLLRRVYYDLTGLPPTFEEIRAFEKLEWRL